MTDDILTRRGDVFAKWGNPNMSRHAYLNERRPECTA